MKLKVESKSKMPNCLKCIFCNQDQSSQNGWYFYYCSEFEYLWRGEDPREYFSFLEGNCMSYQESGSYICPMCERKNSVKAETYCPSCLAKLDKLENLKKEVAQLERVAKAVNRDKFKIELKPKLKVGQRKVQIKEEE